MCRICVQVHYTFLVVFEVLKEHRNKMCSELLCYMLQHWTFVTFKFQNSSQNFVLIVVCAIVRLSCFFFCFILNKSCLIHCSFSDWSYTWTFCFTNAASVIKQHIHRWTFSLVVLSSGIVTADLVCDTRECTLLSALEMPFATSVELAPIVERLGKWSSTVLKLTHITWICSVIPVP
jgi:hypothetical protein